MINPQWLELPMSRKNFHGPKDVNAIEVRLYMGMAASLLNEPWLFVQILTPFNCRLHMKFEKKWPRGFRGKIIQSGGRTDDGRGVITLGHPEPSAQVS